MHGLDEPERIDAEAGGALGESAVAVVAEQLAVIGVARDSFVADEEVNPAVIVEIEPRAGLEKDEN